jgi:peptidoglycan hydrolase-like protein with peptidoglycan-binding domain
MRIGSKGKSIVMQIQEQLNALGCGPIDVDGDFGRNTERAVKLFQGRFTDTDGRPLVVDGEVGPITWTALFGAETVVSDPLPASTLLDRALQIASTQVGVREQPKGSNRGPEVDEYLRAVGLNPAHGSFAWCVAFAFWCFKEAARDLGRANPLVKTAGVLDHWNKAGQKGIQRITTAKAVGNPALVRPGHLFVMDFGGGLGHLGIVERVAGGRIVTIEGNSNEGGSREGIGVFRRDGRKINSINKGFVDYSAS